MQIAYLPQLNELCHPIISNYNCISFFNVFYADIQVANEAIPALWSPLLRLAGLNCFVSITDRQSEQLDNNKETRWGNGLDSFILIMLIMHPTVLNQCWSVLFDSSSWMLLNANKFITQISNTKELSPLSQLIVAFLQNSNTFCAHGMFHFQFPSQQSCYSILLLFYIEQNWGV